MAMKRDLSPWVVLFFLILLGACADNGFVATDAGGDKPLAPDAYAVVPDLYVNPCAPDPAPTVTGKVFAPNGTDPIAGALVFVPNELPPLPKEVRCASWCTVVGSSGCQTYAQPDGSFELVGVPNGKFQLVIQKGYFRRVLELEMPHCGSLALEKAQTTLPAKNAHYGPLDTIPNIGVVTGAWDKLEKVLQKIGVQEMTIYNGKDLGSGAQSMQSLLQNSALMRSHHLLFINCGTKFEGLVTEAGAARNVLFDYVKQGGRLFVTDYSYDFIEQTFPQFVDYVGSDETAVDQAETHNGAEKGADNLIVKADVLDPSMKSWLGLPEIDSLLADGRVEIQGFETGWAVQQSLNSALPTKSWVEAEVTWVGGSGTRSLTSSYAVADTDGQGCGHVYFSSYHTWGQAEELLPQERILEYLMLEMGSCRDPI